MKELLLKASAKGQNFKFHLMKKAKAVQKREEGLTTLEIIVIISVILVISTTLFLFKDSIVDFINSARGQVDSFEVQ